MRSQNEILNFLSKIESDGGDVFGFQREILTYKLSWDNAKRYNRVNKKYHNDRKVRDKWKTLARLDEPYLRHQIHESMFNAFEAVIQNLPMDCLAWVDYMSVFIWLTGPKHDAILKKVLRMYQGAPRTAICESCEKILREICHHYGLDTKTYIREWERSTIIQPNQKRIIT